MEDWHGCAQGVAPAQHSAQHKRMSILKSARCEPLAVPITGVHYASLVNRPDPQQRLLRWLLSLYSNRLWCFISCILKLTSSTGKHHLKKQKAALVFGYCSVHCFFKHHSFTPPEGKTLPNSIVVPSDSCLFHLCVKHKPGIHSSHTYARPFMFLFSETSKAL